MRVASSNGAAVALLSARMTSGASAANSAANLGMSPAFPRPSGGCSQTGPSWQIVRGKGHEHADVPHSLLPAGLDRPRRRAAEQRDEPPPFLIELHPLPHAERGPHRR